MNTHTEVIAGQEAPDFTLLDQQRDGVSLSEFRHKKNVVLFFYPKDYSPICILESIAFREAYHKFKEAGAEVLGISADPPDTHSDFCDFLKLPFRLLTDRSNQVRKRYGAKNRLGLNAARVTYVIDKEGVIRGKFIATFAAKQHVNQALNILKVPVNTEAQVPVKTG